MQTHVARLGAAGGPSYRTVLLRALLGLGLALGAWIVIQTASARAAETPAGEAQSATQDASSSIGQTGATTQAGVSGNQTNVSVPVSVSAPIASDGTAADQPSTQLNGGGGAGTGTSAQSGTQSASDSVGQTDAGTQVGASGNQTNVGAPIAVAVPVLSDGAAANQPSTQSSGSGTAGGSETSQTAGQSTDGSVGQTAADTQAGLSGNQTNVAVAPAVDAPVLSDGSTATQPSSQDNRGGAASGGGGTIQTGGQAADGSIAQTAADTQASLSGNQTTVAVAPAVDAPVLSDGTTATQPSSQDNSGGGASGGGGATQTGGQSADGSVAQTGALTEADLSGGQANLAASPVASAPVLSDGGAADQSTSQANSGGSGGGSTQTGSSTSGDSTGQTSVQTVLPVQGNQTNAGISPSVNDPIASSGTSTDQFSTQVNGVEPAPSAPGEPGPVGPAAPATPATPGTPGTIGVIGSTGPGGTPILDGGGLAAPDAPLSGGTPASSHGLLRALRDERGTAARHRHHRARSARVLAARHAPVRFGAPASTSNGSGAGPAVPGFPRAGLPPQTAAGGQPNLPLIVLGALLLLLGAVLAAGRRRVLFR